MIDEIIQLLLKYREKQADENYFIELNQILVKYNSVTLNDYNGLEIITKKDAMEKWHMSELSTEFFYAAFYEPEKKIYLLLENMMKKTRDSDNFNLSEYGHNIFTNLMRSITVFHEFEHLLQMKGKSGIEGLLTKECPAENKGYALSPREHFANLHSTILAYQIAKKLGMPDSVINYLDMEIKYTIQNPYFYNNADDYGKDIKENAPLDKFYEYANMNNPLNNDYIRNIGFIERIVYEFPITMEEYENYIPIRELKKIDVNEIIEILNHNLLETDLSMINRSNTK